MKIVTIITIILLFSCQKELQPLHSPSQNLGYSVNIKKIDANSLGTEGQKYYIEYELSNIGEDSVVLNMYDRNDSLRASYPIYKNGWDEWVFDASSIPDCNRYFKMLSNNITVAEWRDLCSVPYTTYLQDIPEEYDPFLETE